MGDTESTGGKTTVRTPLERTKEADEAFEVMRATCPHNEGMSDPTQTMAISPGAILVITSNCCKKCGFFFTNQTIIPTGASGGGIAVPHMVMK